MIKKVILVSSLLFSTIGFAERPMLSSARPESKLCDVKVEIIEIIKLSEMTGVGARVEMLVDVKKSTCPKIKGKIKTGFHWDPVARFKHRNEVLKLSNLEITKASHFKKGTVISAKMDSYDHGLRELNGLRLPAP